MFVANKIEQGFNVFFSKFSKHTEPIKQRPSTPEWARKEILLIATEENREIDDPNQFEIKLTLTDKTRLGTWLSNINLKLNPETNKLEGVGNDPLGPSEWTGEKIGSGYYLMKKYSQNNLFLATEENVFFVLQKSKENNIFDGHYYYLHNDNLTIKDAKELVENNPKPDQLTLGGQSCMVINNVLNSEDIQMFKKERLDNLPPIIGSTPQNVLKYIEEVRKKITNNQNREARCLETNISYYIPDPRTGMGIFRGAESGISINLVDACLLTMIDHHDIMKRRGLLKDPKSKIYKAKNYGELKEKLV